jgi:CHASE2 domain-containing sensor protein
MRKPDRIIRMKTAGFGFLVFILGCILSGMLFQLKFVYGVYELLESFLYYQTFSSSASPHENLILIDEKDTVYDRSTFAGLINGLDRQGAKVIGFDVLFSGTGDARQDEQLAEATRKSNSKVIHAAEFYGIERNSVVPDRFQIQFTSNSGSGGFIEGIYGVTLPYPGLLDASNYIGNITCKSDIAGRGDQYFPLLIKYNDKVFPSLPLLAALRYRGYTADSLIAVEDDHICFGTGTDRLSIPTDGESQLLINFIPSNRFSGKVFSVEEALDRIKTDSRVFKDKLVLIGNSFDSQEQLKGPHFQNYPALFVYATIASQILNGQNITEGILESLLMGLVFIVLGLLWLFFLKSPRIRSWMVFVFSFILFLAVAYVSLKSGTRLYILLPYLVFCLTMLAAAGFYRRLISGIKTVFISYSSKDLVFAQKLNGTLEKNDILTLIDFKMPPGKDLMRFVSESIRKSDYTVLVVSKNSLDSDWVYVEFMETMAHEHVMETRKFVPLCIDNGVFDKAYQMKLVNDLMARLDTVSQSIAKLKERNLSADNFETEEKRIKEHQVNLDKMLTNINSALAVDLSTDQKFDENIQRVIKLIKGKKSGNTGS